MRANRVFELVVARRGDVDHVEVLDIASGEIVFFWDLYPHHTGRMARALRADLASLEVEDFAAKWSEWDPGAG